MRPRRRVIVHVHDAGTPPRFEESKHSRNKSGEQGGQFAAKGQGTGSGGAAAPGKKGGAPGGEPAAPPSPFEVRKQQFQQKAESAVRKKQQEKTGSPHSAEEHAQVAEAKKEEAAAGEDAVHQALSDWGAGEKAYNKLRTDPEFGKVIDMLPPYQGTVSRGMMLPADEARFFTAGRTFTLSKHSSATTDPKVAEQFAVASGPGKRAGSIPMVLEIEGARGGLYAEQAGKDAAWWEKSERQTENEVILKAGGRVAIQGVERTEQGLRVKARWVS